METDDPEGIGMRENRAFSLLTLADLAIALQDQGVEHNYARNYDLPQVLDAQSLLVKERDHNYSTCSRTELRGRAKSSQMKRSSSEENLTTTSENIKSPADDFSFIPKKSLSCEQVITSESPPSPIKTMDENSSMNKLCSSWPKTSSRIDYMNDSLSMKHGGDILAMNPQTVCDHTYACDKAAVVYLKDHSYGVVKGKFSFNDPRKMMARKSKQLKNNMINFGSEKTPATLLSKSSKSNLLPFDHNYTFRTIQSHQPTGSVESLDMDFSESDTDSCEETVEEESKLYQKQKLNTKQDHPYSKSCILSF